MLRRLACAILGHRPLRGRSKPDGPVTFKTLIFTYSGEVASGFPGLAAGREITYHYEPCLRCGEIVLASLTVRSPGTGVVLEERKT